MLRRPRPREPYNPHLKQAFLDTVENQIRDGTPPEAKLTLDRLISLGYSRQEAVEKIAAVVAEEAFYVLRDRREFNEEWYVTRLHELIYSLRGNSGFYISNRAGRWKLSPS